MFLQTRGSVAITGVGWLIGILLAGATSATETWPALPETDGLVVLPAQEWPLQPGPRMIEIAIHYPKGRLDAISPQTGLMLTLHNWGGTRCVGTADPRELTKRFNVVTLCVDYLQSGRPSIDGPEPYDCGYLQALDALRALWFVHDGLTTRRREFARGRVYSTGGSGGGNVSLMCNKLAPRTFACVIDMCGMTKLSDDVAFHLPGGSDLNARYSRDPASPNFLSSDAQEIRFVGCPEHLETMRRLGNMCRVIVVHGREDTTCPFAEAEELADLMSQSGLNVEPRFIGKDDLDGESFTSAGHALGNRTKIVFRVADRFLLPDAPTALVRKGSSDFDLRDSAVRYRTSRGEYVIDYRNGYPVGRFEPFAAPVDYKDHLDLTFRQTESGDRTPIRSADDWSIRRRHVLASLQEVLGPLPGPSFRVPLRPNVIEEARVGKLIRRKITFQSDPDDSVPAYLFLPERPTGARLPAILCLHQTTKLGKSEPAGLGGNADLHYALELAQRGYVTLAPDYPSFGEHTYDFDERHGYVSGSMKAVWDNIRGVDYLQSLAEVDPARIGCVGHSLGGHSAMFTAAFDTRIKAIVSSCGFTRFAKDDMPSWTGKTYMPRIASVYGNSAERLPFDFPEIVATFAPRPFFACAATRDDDFDVAGVRETLRAAGSVYDLFGARDRLQAYFPDVPHSFPADARNVAYEFLDKHLK